LYLKIPLFYKEGCGEITNLSFYYSTPSFCLHKEKENFEYLSLVIPLTPPLKKVDLKKIWYYPQKLSSCK
jgi:hypothetical protein